MALSKTITFRVSARELAALDAAAAEHGTSLSSYIRSLVLTGRPPTSNGDTLDESIAKFVKRLADFHLEAILHSDTDPAMVQAAAAEIQYRYRARIKLEAAIAVDPSVDQSAPPIRKPPAPYRSANDTLPRHLQENNPAAREIARALALLPDDDLRARLSFDDKAVAAAAERELARRAMGVRLFHKRGSASFPAPAS